MSCKVVKEKEDDWKEVQYEEIKKRVKWRRKE